MSGALSSASNSSVANTATIAPPAGATDPNPGNNTATDTDALARVADLSITKNVDLAHRACLATH